MPSLGAPRRLRDPSAPPMFVVWLKTLQVSAPPARNTRLETSSPSHPAPKASHRALLRSSALSGDSAREVLHPVMEKRLWKTASAEPGLSLARAVAGSAVSSPPAELQKARPAEAGLRRAAFAPAHWYRGPGAKRREDGRCSSLIRPPEGSFCCSDPT